MIVIHLKKKKISDGIGLFFIESAFGSKLKIQLILLFSLFFKLFMRSIAVFCTIHKSHYTILVNFYIYLQYF